MLNHYWIRGSKLFRLFCYPQTRVFGVFYALKWNMLVGTQYHYSKHWEFRVEVGFWNEKLTSSANNNYRFGLGL
jgi:hypothetical protein